MNLGRIQAVRALSPFRMGSELTIHHCECASRHYNERFTISRSDRAL